MSPAPRPLTGEVLLFDLEREEDQLANSATGRQGGRHARTLLKNGPLRVTLVVLTAGATIAEHQAEGPITVQPLRGRIRFTAGTQVHEVGPGELLCAGPGVRHAVASADGAVFLLTVVQPASAEERTPAG